MHLPRQPECTQLGATHALLKLQCRSTLPAHRKCLLEETRLIATQAGAHACPDAAQAPAHGAAELQHTQGGGGAGNCAPAHPRDLARAQHRAFQRQRARRQRLRQ